MCMIAFGWAFVSIHAATITSINNGLWSSPGTWSSNSVPASADDVIINSNVSLDMSTTVQSLTINAGKTLQDNGSSYTLTINGNTLNNGIIARHPALWYFDIRCKGNVVNNGSWKPNKTYFSGNGNQLISGTGVFENEVIITDTLGEIIMQSAIRFSGSSLYGNNAWFKTNGYTFYAENQNLYGLRIISSDTLYLRGSVMEDIAMNGSTKLKGRSYFKSGNESSGTLILLDTISSNYASYTFSIKGNIVNRGAILRDPNGWYDVWDIQGNIENYGLWKPYKTRLSGSSNQAIRSGTGNKFENLVEISDTLGDIVLMSAVVFEGSELLMNGARVLTNGYSLITQNQYLYNGRIEGNDTLVLNESVIQNIIFKGQTKLNGNTYFKSGCESYTSLTILDTIRSNYASYTFNIQNDLINKGAILRDPSGWYDEWRIKGSVYNYGIWSPYQTVLNGTAEQRLFAGQGMKFEGRFYIEDTIRDVKLISPVLFYGNQLNLGDARLLTNGHQLTTKDQFISNGRIVSNDTVLLDYSIMEDLEFTGQVKQKGKLFYRSGNKFVGTLTVVDTLIDDHASYVIEVYGNLINKGAILRNTTSWYNKIFVTGNIENYGTWKPFQTQLSGNATQFIKCGLNNWIENDLIVTDTIGDVWLNGPLNIRFNTLDGNKVILHTNGHPFKALDCNLSEINFESNDTIRMPDSRIEDCSFKGNYALDGNIYYRSGNSFWGVATILDTLISNYASYELQVYGHIINRGAILRDGNAWYNRLYIRGNIENYGIWNPFETILTGQVNQTIKAGKNVSFENYFTIGDTVGDTYLLSDVSFTGKTLQLNGSKLYTNGHRLMATDEEVLSGSIITNDTLWFYNSVISDLRIQGNFTMTGKWYLKSGNEFTGNVYVRDTVMDNYASYVWHIKGNLFNYGVIKRAPSNWYFKIYAHGSIFNKGILDPHEIYLVDTGVRTIGGPSALSVSCAVLVDDSIQLAGTNMIPTFAFTGNSKAWCRILPQASLQLNNPNIGSRLINYGTVTVQQEVDTNVTGSYGYYRASTKTKAHSACTRITVDHYGYQQHPTSDNALNTWWRLRNNPQLFSDSLQELKLYYTADVLNGNREDSLRVYHSANAGISWNRIKSGIALDSAANTVTIQSAPSYGHYLLTSGSAGSLSFNPMLSKAEPRFGGNSGNVTLYLFGAGFNNDCVVRLHKTGTSDILADTVYITDITGESMLATFNLKNKPVGIYDVVVEIPGKSSLTLSAYFEIKQGERSKPWVLLTGRDRFLINRWQTFNLTYGNTANTDARGTMIIFTISDKPGLEVSFPDFRFVLPQADIAKGSGYTRIADSVKLYYVTDTFTGFEGQRIRVYPIYIPVIAAQSTESVRVRIKLTGSGDISMNTWLLDPLYETIDLYGKSGEPMPNEVRLCVTAAAMKAFANGAIGLIPGAECYNAFEKTFDPIGYITPEDMKPGDAKITGSGLWGWVSWASSVTQCATSFMPGLGQATQLGIAIGGFIIDVVDNKLTQENCWAKFRAKSGNKHNAKGVTSFDPNEMVGPQGYGTDHYISKTGQKQYRIYFENKATATAPALEVFIYDTLDKKKFDLSTFSFGHVTFADTTVYVQEYAKAFSLLVDRYPKQHVIVQINGTLDTSNGALYVSFHSLDRITLELTEYDSLGFLLPNKVSPEGEGNIGFSVLLNQMIAHKDYVRNKATIVFDFNPPIVTNEFSNRIDMVAPVSTMQALPAISRDSVFMVSWSGTDDGAGIKSYTIMVSENDSAYTVWKSNTNATSAQWYGRNFNKYEFYCLATDSIGHTEQIKTSADVSTYVYDNTAIPENERERIDFRIYPNPAKGLLYLQSISAKESHAEVRLVDLMGRLVYQDNLSLQTGVMTNTIQIPELRSGLYLVEVRWLNRMKVMKVIIER